jgi:nucleoside-diphosphate-sugar epimerase
VRALDWLNVERVHADALDPVEINLAVEGMDSVYDLAPSGSRGTSNVVAACIASGVSRLVLLGSAGDRLMQTGIDRGLDIVAVSAPDMIGPWDFVPSVSGRLLIDVWEGRRSADLTRLDVADVRDVADAFVAAGERGETGKHYAFSRNGDSRPLDETIADTKRWFFDHGMLQPASRLAAVAS